jgi:hypothetical protein
VTAYRLASATPFVLRTVASTAPGMPVAAAGRMIIIETFAAGCQPKPEPGPALQW